ncbi:MAG: hypothetical protein GY699_20565 [Desulfobacteraceae bacterium]|nr:hypothetical protein [Desulfobacteraceae bacterium]
MKKGIFLFFVFFLLQSSCFARDHIVEFVEENYKETQSSFSYFPLIYHSIQVRSKAGPKLLILKGDDYHHRKWLRQYIAQGKQFIAQVPDNENDLFIKSSAFEIDITRIHPLNLSMYRQGEEKTKTSLKQNQDRKDGHKSSNYEEIKQISKQELDKKKAKKNRLAKVKKRRKGILRKKAAPKKYLGKKSEKCLTTKEDHEEIKLRKKSEKTKKDKAEFITALIERRQIEEQRRRQESEQRWLEFKARLSENERIRALEQEEQKIEFERRWTELRQRYNF